jgi:CspA family cold shock protein
VQTILRVDRSTIAVDMRTETTWLTMSGTSKTLTGKGFGFIETADGQEYFFHQSACAGVRFDELREGQAVTFEKGQGPNGPRAENVRRA